MRGGVAATRLAHIQKIARAIPALATILLALALATGCASRVIYRPAVLPLPARPVLTAVPAADVQCLAPNTYRTLVLRERALRAWGLALEAIIHANNRKADGN